MLREPARFEFAQAVRLLGRLHPERAPVGGAADPLEELVRFRADLSAGFPPGDVCAARDARDGRPASLEVCFLGVATPASFGSLPRHYAERLRAPEHAPEPAARDFLDLFNHRWISLFFRACERHRPVLLHERGPDNPLERALAALLGLATRGLAGRTTLPDRALWARAGLLARRPLSALSLRALLQSVFCVPAEVRPFRAVRHRMDVADRTRLGRANARLGEDLCLGEEVVLVDGRFRVCLGPLGFERYRSLLPDGRAFRALCDLLRLATRGELEFEVQLLLRRAEAPRARLGGDPAEAGRLGWSCWLGSAPGEAPLADAVLREAPAGARAEVCA